jgi:Family of unknown function (DUF6518)
MPSPSPQPSVLLLERPDTVADPVLDAALRPGSEAGPWPVVVPTVARVPVPLFRAPGLALLAAVSVLEGYLWLGIIGDGGSHPWAVVFAGLAVVAAVALTRTDRERRRSTLQRLLVSTATVTALAAAAVLWRDETWAARAIGIADLALASIALVSLVSGERSRRRGDVAT